MSFGTRKGISSVPGVKKSTAGAPPNPPQKLADRQEESDTLLQLANALGSTGRTLPSYSPSLGAMFTPATSFHDDGLSLAKDPLHVAAGWSAFSMPDFMSSLQKSSSFLDQLEDSAGRTSYGGTIGGCIVLDSRVRPVIDDDMTRRIYELSARAEQQRTLLEVGDSHAAEQQQHGVDTTWRPPAVEVFKLEGHGVDEESFTTNKNSHSLKLEVGLNSVTPRPRSTADVIASGLSIRDGSSRHHRRFGTTTAVRKAEPRHRPDAEVESAGGPSISEVASAKPRGGPGGGRDGSNSRQTSERNQQNSQQGDVAVPDQQAYVARILAGKKKPSRSSSAVASEAGKTNEMLATSSLPQQSSPPRASKPLALEPEPPVARTAPSVKSMSELAAETSSAPHPDHVKKLHMGTSLFRPLATSASPPSQQQQIESPRSNQLSSRQPQSVARSSDDGASAAAINRTSLALQHKLAATVDRLADEVNSIKQRTKTIQDQLVEQQLREQAGFISPIVPPSQPLLAAPHPQPPLPLPGHYNSTHGARDEFFARMGGGDLMDDAINAVVSAATTTRREPSTASTICSTPPLLASIQDGRGGADLAPRRSNVVVIPPAPSFDIVRLENIAGRRSTTSAGNRQNPQGLDRMSLTLADIADGRTAELITAEGPAVRSQALLVMPPTPTDVLQTRRRCLDLLSRVEAFVREELPPSTAAPVVTNRQRVPGGKGLQ